MTNLDIGCGSKRQFGYIGVDINKLAFPDVLASADMLPIKDSCVDRIYSRRCIQHVKNDKLAFEEIKRVLRPEGVAVIVLSSWRGFLWDRLLKVFRGSYATFHPYTRKKLEKLMSGSQVTKLKSKRFLGQDFQIIFRQETKRK